MDNHGGLNVNWGNLADSIDDGNVVLVLGPDAIPFYPLNESSEIRASSEGNISFSKLTTNKILKTSLISYYYANDNLFLFNSVEDKNEARDIVKKQVADNNWIADEELLRNIVSIPFSVILNFSPDEIIYKAYLKYTDIKPQFDFCTPYNKEVVEIKKPTKENPLIYNLCGNAAKKKDSCILDYFDLFQLFTKLLGKQIPDALKFELYEAQKFILLGFQLDKWYSQLLIHYLNWLEGSANLHKNFKRNFPVLSQLSGDSREFVLKQFNISHIAPSREDFNELYNACKQRDILRLINRPDSPFIEQLKFFLKQDKIEETFKLLENKIKDKELEMELISLRGYYSNWKNAQGRERKEDLDIQIANIRDTLIYIANQTM